MPDALIHERLYRGAEALELLGMARVAICGAGALGGHLAENLVRQGVRQLTVVDRDRVEAHNLGTQIHEEGDVGAFKAEVLRARCFRAAGVEIEALAAQLTERNVARVLRGAALVVDTFDNRASRRLVTEHCRGWGMACLHLGVNADYGEVRWNEHYLVPGDVLEGNACDYPLARNLVLFVVALGSEAILRYLLEGLKQSYCFTLRDLCISDDMP